MSRRIVIEALVVVVQLRIEELFRRFRRRYAAIEAPEAAAADSGRAVTDTGPDPRPAGEGG
jgi:hypothetical protein